jgi:glutaredoxin
MPMTHHDLTNAARACPHCKREVDLDFAQAELLFREQKEAAPLKLTVLEDSSYTSEMLTDAHPIEEPDPGPELTILVTFECWSCHKTSELEVELWRP